MNLRLLLTSTVLGLSLVACNGGGSAPSPTGIVGGTVTQSIPTVPSPTTVGSISTYTLPLNSATLSTLGLSSNPSIALPSSVTPAGATTVSNAVPAGVSTFSAVKGARVPQSETLANATALIYAGFVPSADFSIPAQSAISLGFTFSSTPSSDVDYYLAFFNGASWVADTTDVGVVDGNALNISLTTPAALTLSSGTQYAIVLFTLPKTSASASPTPSASATPASISTEGSLSIGTSSTTVSGTVAGASASATIPGATEAATLPYAFSVAAPQGVVAPSSGVTTVYAYGKFSPTTNITFPTGSTVSASGSFSGVTPSGDYKVAVSTDGTTWTYGLGTSTVSDSTLSMTYTSSNAVTLAANTVYYAALYK